MAKTPYLSAQEAATELGIKLPTLYSYVSRGLIRSETSSNDPRERHYSAEDVQHLKERQEQSRDPKSAIAKALHWGAPVLESSLTLINDGRLYYRGRDVVMLASSHTIEQVIGLLWKGNLQMQVKSLHKPLSRSERNQTKRILSQVHDYPLLEAFQMALLLAAMEDPAAYNLQSEAVEQTSGRILRLLIAVAAGQSMETSITQTLVQSWLPAQPAKGSQLINTVLILLADHEFNVSSFTARCVASASATPYEVVIAGLAALQGSKHGGSVNRVEALLDEVRKPANAHRVLSRRLKHGESIPGFGHPLYPAGDPRAQLLLNQMLAANPRASALSISRAVMHEARLLLGEEPNSDFALATLTRLLNLPEGYGLGIFALSRTIGWLAHAMEEYQVNRLIRPRARYVGPIPQPTAPETA